MAGSAPTRSRACAAVAAALSFVAGAGCAGAPPHRAPDPPARAAAGAVSPGRTSAAAPRLAPAPGAGTAHAKAAALLVGVWRPVGAADGRDAQDRDLALEFRADGTWSIAGATYHARGNYRWIAADEIALTTVDSNLPTQVGATSRRRVAVDASALALTAAPQDGRRAGDGVGVGVTTEFRRAPGR